MLRILGYLGSDLEGSVDNDGHRGYKASALVESTTLLDGPYDVLQLFGIPRVGDPYTLYGGTDEYALCQPGRTVVPHESDNGKVKIWKVNLTFSTKPNGRCQEASFTTPLEEPMKIKITSNKRTVEATQDRFGLPIRNSAHELVKGPIIEFDEGTLTVEIEQNVLNSELNLVTLCFNRVNSGPLWGLGRRKIRLTGASADRQVFGRCSYYWHRSLKFDIDDKTFDRDVLDEGTKVLQGHWATKAELEASGTGTPTGTGTQGQPPEVGWVIDRINGRLPDPNNPSHFKRYQDREGNLARVILNGSGLPANTSYFYPVFTPGTGTGTDASVSVRYDPLGTGLVDLSNEGGPGYFRVEKYLEANFLLLGIPTDLDFSSISGTGTEGY